ncbi:TPA: hypothetical protein RQO74_000192 [Klebsiella michiganensis]|nr:hypothetical protein [Klebsiella michiganensis]
MTHEEQRDEALKMLKEVLKNYQYNKRKGIGMGPLSRAKKLLDRYGLFDPEAVKNTNPNIG